MMAKSSRKAGEHCRPVGFMRRQKSLRLKVGQLFGIGIACPTEFAYGSYARIAVDDLRYDPQMTGDR